MHQEVKKRYYSFMKKKALLLVIAGLFLAGCTKQYNYDPEPFTTPEVVDTDYCVAAQTNLKKLECKRPDGVFLWINEKGELFGVTCQRIQDEGGVFVNPRCLAEATNCKEVEKCPIE